MRKAFNAELDNLANPLLKADSPSLAIKCNSGEARLPL
jgi:hypothetical protein